MIIFVLFLILALTQTVFSQGLSKTCVDELLALPEKKKNFDLQGFLIKDLPAEVVKVKAQMKLPFGKPKDDKVTDIGVTVGCLKGFPENPVQIQAMLKDVGLEMAKRSANKLGANAAAGAQAAISPTGLQSGGAANIITSKASATPVLKNCNVEFNKEEKFCYDGEVYDKCDEMIYNPTTYICFDDIARRALCNGVQYNPLTQKCENNSIISVCGESEYNPETHGCKNNEVVRKQTVVEKEVYAESLVGNQWQEEEFEETEVSEKSIFSLGFRIGLNFSHVYESYKYSYNTYSGESNSKANLNMGLVFDFAASSWFNFQPGIMYIKKGGEYKGNTLDLYYIEVPILASFKLSALRLNLGPYFSGYQGFDYGFSYGGGFDIGNFYFGMFYDYGSKDLSRRSNYETYNRALGFNLGYNL